MRCGRFREIASRVGGYCSMKTSPFVASFASVVSLGLAAGGLLLATDSLRAQPRATGTIEGRVFDARRGEFVEKARLTVEGSREEVLTDVGGQYRLANLPAGPVKINIFYTGLGSQSVTVTVNPGQVVQHDITLRAVAGKPGAGGDAVVKLDAFTVAPRRRWTEPPSRSTSSASQRTS